MNESNVKSYVSYLRVSTIKQGNSGLGIEAQRNIIKDFLGEQKPIREFEEIASGRKNYRPKLKEALDLCEKTGATLIVSTLDRLSRDVNFINQLLDSNIEIIFCDCPEANRSVIESMAILAQYEIKKVSERTKLALNEKKRQGYKLGNPEHLLNKLDEAVRKSNETNRKKALENLNNKKAISELKELVKQGLSLQKMADILNERGFLTSRGYKFKPVTVGRLLKRYDLYSKKQKTSKKETQKTD